VQGERIYLPRSECSLSYVNQLRRNSVPYHVPLQSLLLNAELLLSPSTNDINIDDYGDYDPDFTWPEVFARATNSVESVLFNPTPPPPRIYATSDTQFQECISKWNHGCSLYYSQKLESKNNDYLTKYILPRKVNYSGELPSTTGKLLFIFNKLKG
jgi:hypothetical protein